MDSVRTELGEKLRERARKEHKDFLVYIRKMPVDEVISRAFEIDTMENARQFVEYVRLEDLSNAELEFLLKQPSILGFLYEEWRDCDHSELFDFFVEDIKMAAKDHN